MMIVKCRQGTPEWHAARCGKITASRAQEAVAMSERYATDLAIERISGRPRGVPVKGYILDRGHELEDVARRLYQAKTGYRVTQSGLAVSDDGIFGYSTDGIVRGMPAGVEVKAPYDGTKTLHILRTGDLSEYMHQMQMGMWMMGWQWLDFIMCDPDLENIGLDLYVRRVPRNDVFIDSMVLSLAKFDALVNKIEADFRAAARLAQEVVKTAAATPEALPTETIVPVVPAPTRKPRTAKPA